MSQNIKCKYTDKMTCKKTQISSDSLSLLFYVTNFFQSHFCLDRHPFNSLFSRIICVSRYQKGKTILDFNEVKDNGVAVASAGPHANHLNVGPCR